MGIDSLAAMNLIMKIKSVGVILDDCKHED